MPAAVGWVLLLWGACCRRAAVGCLLLHPRPRGAGPEKVAQSSAESGMSVLVRRLSAAPPSSAPSRAQSAPSRALVLVVTSTRVAFVHDPCTACLRW